MAEAIPCLVVRQPYASLIAYGKKRWEFRSYNTRKRGHILVAASRGRPIETADEILNEAAKSFPRGALLASARLVHSRLVTAIELKERAASTVKTRIGSFEFWTADAPVGEPLTDVRAIPPTWQCYAWQLNDVKALPAPIPLTSSPCSSWTLVDTDQVL